jgi:transcriptional regulator with PAS, ATPase and Fis domain
MESSRMQTPVYSVPHRNPPMDKALPRRSQEAAPSFSFWGKAEPVRALQNKIAIAARHDIPVLIVGESGSGKEVLAREVWKHRRENRGMSASDAPFVAVNSAAIPADIAESLLFGHERGAFTSARDRQFGRFELARKGSLFLDELQCLELNTQSKLLRVLESRSFEPLGSRESKTLECQLIFASNIPLEILVEQKRMRRDLYYRLSMLQIYLIPLREQREILPEVAEKMLQKIKTNFRLRKSLGLDPQVLQRFALYDWPGNFRELEHVILYGALHCSDDLISENDLPPQFQTDWQSKLEGGRWY